jgi:hypothetical protein
MPYSTQTWIDNDATKPLSAARMGVIETGIQTAQAAAEGAQTTANNAQTSANNAVKRWSTFIERNGIFFNSATQIGNPLFLLPTGMMAYAASSGANYVGTAMFSYYPSDYDIASVTQRMRLKSTIYGGNADMTGVTLTLAIYAVSNFTPQASGYAFSPLASPVSGTEVRHLSPGANNNNVASATFNASILNAGSGTYALGFTTDGAIPGSSAWLITTRLEIGYV